MRIFCNTILRHGASAPASTVVAIVCVFCHKCLGLIQYFASIVDLISLTLLQDVKLVLCQGLFLCRLVTLAPAFSRRSLRVSTTPSLLFSYAAVSGAPVSEFESLNMKQQNMKQQCVHVQRQHNCKTIKMSPCD